MLAVVAAVSSTPATRKQARSEEGMERFINKSLFIFAAMKLSLGMLKGSLEKIINDLHSTKS